MRYAVARFEDENRKAAYRFYMAESARGIVSALGGEMPTLYDVLNPPTVDPRTADEVVDGLREKLRKLEEGES